MAAAVGQALGHLGSVAQFVEIGQGHAHQQEQLRWTRRCYVLDTQTLRLDLLSAAKGEIRAHYDIYVGRLDTFLLINALLMPFGLASLQFSGPFILRNGEDGSCDDAFGGTCIEAEHKWIITFWSWLVALILIFPFWSILMLIRCKLKLDSWLERSLASLNRERRITINNAQGQINANGSKSKEETVHEEMEQVVSRLGGFIVHYQDQFARIWNMECNSMVIAAVVLLWTSAAMAVILVSVMFWIFLYNRTGHQHSSHIHFIAVNALGVAIPVVYIIWHFCTHESVTTPFAPVSPEVGYRHSLTRTPSADDYRPAPSIATESQVTASLASAPR